MKQATYVGVDVSKKQLDVAIRPLGKVCGVNNDRKGISQLVKRLKKLQPPAGSKRNWRIRSLPRSSGGGGESPSGKQLCEVDRSTRQD